MGGRGTVAQYRSRANFGYLSFNNENIPVSKIVRGNKTEYNKETGRYERRILKDVDYSRITKKEATLAIEVQKALQKSNKHSIIYDLPKELKIDKIHIEDRTEWSNRHSLKEAKGSKNAYDIDKDSPFILRKTKGGGTTLVITWSATQQGVKKLSGRYKKNKGVARSVSEAILREQAKLVYHHLKVKHPQVYNDIHNQLIKYNSQRPTSNTANKAIQTRRSTMESFADSYVLNATKRKSSFAKPQRAVVRGALHWVGDRNFNRPKSLGATSKLYRLEDEQRKKLGSYDKEAYKNFISKYTKKR